MNGKQEVDRRLLIAAAVAAVFLAVIVGVRVVGGGGDSDRGSQAATVSTTYDPARSTIGNGAGAAPTTPTRTGPDISDIESGSATRPTQPDDEANDTAAIRVIVPLWATFDPASDDTAAHWVTHFNNSPAAAEPFIEQSRNDYLNLWGGAMQQGVSVKGVRIVSIRPLKNAGATATYLVVVKQSVNSADGPSAIAGDVQQTWVFTVAHTANGSQVMGYSDPPTTG